MTIPALHFFGSTPLAAYDHTVAHDLKNPLGIVIGYAHLLEDDYANLTYEEIQMYLHAITKSGQKNVHHY